MTLYAETFVHLAETQAGARYVWGAKEPATDPNPKSHGGAFDCSGLVSWAVRRAGGTIPDGSQGQLDYCRQHGTLIPVAKAEFVRGALLFLGNDGDEHVVIARGDGTTIEARGAAYGVGEWSATRTPWVAAARVPGFVYGPGSSPPQPTASQFVVHVQAAVGLPASEQDGKWGNQTEAAVVAHRWHHDTTVAKLQTIFRTIHAGLAVDGIWGDNTDAAYLQAHHTYYMHF